MTVNTLNKALVFSVNAARIVELGHDLQEVIANSEVSGVQRAARVVFDTGSIALRGASSVAPFTKASPNTRIGLETGAEIFDFAQRVSVLAGKKDIRSGEWVDLGCQVAFRAISVTQTTLTLKPELFENQAKNVRRVSDIIGTASRVIQSRDSFQRVYHLGVKQFRRIINFAAERDIVLEVPLNMDADGNDLPLELQLDNETAALIAEIQNARTINEFNVIPELFSTDPQLNQFVCSLSQKPIRRVLVIRGTENANPVYYERAKIARFLQDNSIRIPQGWPMEVSCKRENLATSPSVQNQIDARLQLLFDDFRALSNELVSMEDRIMGLVRQLGIGQASGCEIVDRILERIPRSFVRAVSVQREMKRFTPGEPLKLSTVLFVRSSKVLLEEQDHSNAEKQQATCACLGSSEEDDQEALKNVMKSFRGFKLYISQDLQDLSVNFFK